MAKCRHTHAWFVIDRHGSRRRVWGIYQAWMVHNDPHFGYGDMDTVISASCRNCGATLSLGPSNDDIPLDEIAHATFAKNEGYWMLFEDPEGYDWDVTRPLREQWPLGPADPAHMARGDAMLDAPVIAAIRDSHVESSPREGWQERTLAKIDAFAPSDTASREPWHTTDETQLSDADRAETKLRESVAELVTDLPEGAA